MAAGLSEHYRHIFELTRLNEAIHIYATEAEALAGFKKNDVFWHDTLRSLAAHFSVDGQIQMTATCVDPKMQWSQARNTWHNAYIRSTIYTLGAPLRWSGRLLSRPSRPKKTDG